jgi:hypothetical protein
MVLALVAGSSASILSGVQFENAAEGAAKDMAQLATMLGKDFGMLQKLAMQLTWHTPLHWVVWLVLAVAAAVLQRQQRAVLQQVAAALQ